MPAWGTLGIVVDWDAEPSIHRSLAIIEAGSYVSYSLVGLFAKEPSERLIVPHENPHYPVVFLARWRKEYFDSHGAFIRMTEMYDSAMQGFIQAMSPNDLAKWFVPREDYDVSAPPADVSPSRTEDSVDWLKRNFPFVRVPWLRTGDHIEILVDDESEFGNLIAYGKSGYLYVFVADLL